MSRSAHAPSGSPISALLRDLTVGLRQQMYYWGRDVVHSDGNQLVHEGFTKRRSPGLQGTSCYSLDWQGGVIELHGACAGWYREGEGFVYVRRLNRCDGWQDGEPMVPGDSVRLARKSVPAGELAERMGPFIEWWIQYERAIEQRLGADYRLKCYREHARLPRSRTWLSPEAGIRWIEAFLNEPAGLDRAKYFGS
jgi:hypothetical protein